MRRFAIFPALLLVLTVWPAVASAAGAGGPPTFRDRFTEEFAADDFCESGATVQGVEKTVGNGWEGEDTFMLTYRSRVSFTYGDRTVFLLNAGRIFVEADPSFEGAHTELVVENGIRARLLVPGQGAVTLDHGFLQYVVTFDESGEFVGIEVLKDAGGHPDFYDPVFCAAAIEALGIPTA